MDKKKTIITLISIIVYTILIIFLTLTASYLLRRRDYKNDIIERNEINSLYQKQKIEGFKVIAYAPEVGSMHRAVSLNQILNSSILSEEDKIVLKDSFKRGEYINYYKDLVLYFGIKEGEDYIYIYNPIKEENEPKQFWFRSNLEYSFESIVLDFKNEYNIDLSDEYLESAEYDSSNILSSGIIIKMIYKDVNDYDISYLLKYDGKAYVINK